MLCYLFVFTRMLSTLNAGTAEDITPSQCIADFNVIYVDDVELIFGDDGQFCVPYLRLPDVKDHKFEELAKCVGKDITPETMGNVVLEEISNSNLQLDKFPVSPQLNYVLHAIKCVANYALVYDENVVTDMVNTDQFRVISDTLPDIVNSEMNGFEELKNCFKNLKKPKNGKKSVIGKMPNLFLSAKKESAEKYIKINKLKENPKINRIFQKKLVLSPSKEVADKIVAEMHCVGKFLITKKLASTELIINRKREDKIPVRRIVRQNKIKISKEEEEMFLADCGEVMVRKNALRKHGIGGMLTASYRSIFIDTKLQKMLTKFSIHLSGYLAIKFGSSGAVDFVRLPAARSNKRTADSDESHESPRSQSEDIDISVEDIEAIGTSKFRIQIHSEKVDLGYEIANVEDDGFMAQILEISDTNFELWRQKSMARLVQMFREDQLFLSEESLKDYLDRNPDQERNLYSNMMCIADFMVLNGSIAPIFSEDGQIEMLAYRSLVESSKSTGTLFAELAKCIEEGWIDEQFGQQEFNVKKYSNVWGWEHYQVSAELGKLLENLRCVADYLVLYNEFFRFKSLAENTMRIHKSTMPQKILQKDSNFVEFGEMLKCINEGDGYRILGQFFSPLIQYDKKGKAKIKLVDPNNEIWNKILNHAYISKELDTVIRAKITCVTRALIEEGNVKKTVLFEHKELDDTVKWYRKVEINQKLPENLMQKSRCDELYKNDDDEKMRKMEKELNRRGNSVMKKMVGELIITDEQLLRKLDQQSMCLADFLATHFYPKYMVYKEKNKVFMDNNDKLNGYQFIYESDDVGEFVQKLVQIMQNQGIEQELTECIPKMAKIPQNPILILDTFMGHLNLFDRRQLFLSKQFDLTQTLSNYHLAEEEIGPENICPICHEEFRIEQVAKQLPKCKHYFHAHCIKPWLKEHTNCPSCRAEIFENH